MTRESFRQDNESGPNIAHHGSGDNHHYTIYIGPHAAPAPVGDAATPPAPEDRDPPTTPGGGKGGRAAIAIIAVLAVVVCVILFSGDDDAPPSKPWPPSVSREMILQPVVEKMHLCAKETVLAPRTCPQATTSMGQPSKVRWAVHGYPVDGSAIRYDGRSFTVDGTAIMSVTFAEFSQERREIHVIPYRAVVYQDGGRFHLGSLTQAQDVSSAVNKRKPEAEWPDIQVRVRAAFDRCVSSRRAPMPPGCPADTTVPQADDAIWTLESNPLLDAVQKFDDDTGIVHVRGRYSIHLDSTGPFGDVRQSQSGDYDARVVVGDSGIDVLDICHSAC